MPQETLPPSRRRARAARSLAALPCAGALGLLSGCHSYERAPLDLDSSRAAWLARSPHDESVRAFARALSEAEARSVDAFDPSDGLSLVEAEPVMLVFNPDLRLARLEADVSRATAAHAGLWQDPMLGVDLERILSGAGGDNPWVVGATIGITIPISGRLEAEKARAGAELAAALDRLAAQEWAARTSLRELWIEWSAQRLRAEVAAAFIDRLRDVVSIADRQTQAGVMSRLDARLFHVELAGREAEQLGLAARARELELRLREQMGLAPLDEPLLVPTVGFPARTGDTLEMHRLLEEANPDLLAARSQYEVAERALRAEIRAQWPDLMIGPGFGSDQGDDHVLLGLSLPIPLWNRNQQGVAEAMAQREVERARFETTFERLASRLAIALMQFEAGRAQREMVESILVPLADEQESEARRLAAVEGVEPVLLLEALKAQHKAKLHLIDARAAEALGAVRLDDLLGPPAPAIVAAPPPDAPAPVEGDQP